MNLGELIKEYRQLNKLTMQDFATRSGLSKGYVSMLEKGKHPQNTRNIIPSIETFSKVAVGMGISLNDLLENVDSDQLIDIELPSSSPTLTDEESYVISIYRDMDPVAQVKFVAYGEGLVAASKDYDDMSPAELAADAEREVDMIVAQELEKNDKKELNVISTNK